ncbi:FAD-binding and (Fe-S)-binding domain-containing protein [Kocuria turfanensis]|uniref:D-lactate dehydrogenase (cytochrome) n=1 Tax=Kocuria turfanensis TaxID=388357 RepID=A0A512IAV1_9MICC|nr:FAD-binding and (Fe-S)-binding domain-containing protein [Kocuria turfanensis]GEO94830.1 oxidoreductase [Kocuria turfanensis]
MTVADHSPIAAEALLEDLRTWCGRDAVVDSELEHRALAHDASHYLLQPAAVVRPRSAADMGNLFRAVSRHGLGLTFRSGGTSLSGQAVTDQVLVDVRRNFRDVEVLDGGRRVRVQPGATVRQVNARLAPHGHKLGPDPASEAACTIGGVVANNSSGMACGTRANTYRTLESMVVVLPSGTTVDTAAPDADARLRALEPALHEGLLRLRDRVRADPASVRTIEQQFSMKNTMGYGLNSFLDHDEPVRILEHLLIGSEGTLGFVAQAVFRTVPILPFASTGLLVFPDLASATRTVPALVGTHSATVELLDAKSLKVSQRTGLAPAQIMDVDVDEHAALLVEYQGATLEEERELSAAASGLFRSLDLAAPAALTDDPAARAALWTVRKGLYTTVAGNRPSGSNALLEDVVVPVPELGETCEQLTALFDAHGYRDSVIFGHAKDGNVHFMLNEQFDRPDLLARYERFTQDMVALVLDHRGSLKAEHGTGRNMAPFVRRQYGDELYDVMVELKRLVDPAGLLNPGVLLNEDPTVYVRDLKTAPPVEQEVDRCVECGYCEPVCPSKDITLTPRQRIVGRREIAAAEERGDAALAARLRAEYDYEGLQTCAVDGMCVTACPVLINTGDLVRRLRAENHSRVADAGWGVAAKAWGATTTGAALGLTAAKALPTALPAAATAAARAVLGAEHVPQYKDELPAGGPARPRRQDAGAEAVFFPACINAMFGPPDGEGLTASQAFLALCDRAGVRVTVPEGIGSLCCGTPWKSKGLPSGWATMSERTLAALWEASGQGALPVVCDAASCTEGLETMAELAAASSEYHALRFVDAVEFVADRVLGRLRVTRPVGSMALHPTCSSVHLGVTGAFETIARAISADVVVPKAWGCCAYAGDRGMLHPELTASATAAEAREVNQRRFDAYASLNRTCEQGMTEATGHAYRHVLEHLEAATR